MRASGDTALRPGSERVKRGIIIKKKGTRHVRPRQQIIVNYLEGKLNADKR